MSFFRKLGRSVLRALPFKRRIFTLVRAVGTPPERIYKHLYFKGQFSVEVPGGGRFTMLHHGHVIENELFWRGLEGWEKVSFELWTRLCRISGTILDIGANTGVYAMVAQAVRPDARIVAAEPVERVFRKLQANVDLNGGGVQAVCAAISDRSGTAVLYDIPDSDHVLSVSLDPEWNKESTRLRPVEVPCLTVMDLLGTVGAEKVDLLKIDVETHEPAVLQGFLDILRRDRPTMLIELLTDEVAARVASQIEGLGYEYFNIDDVTWPPQRVATLGRSDHFNFLVCQPHIARAIGL